MKERNSQKQVWAHKLFKERLEKIKAKRLLNGNPVKNLGELTKKMLECPSFETLEKELISEKELKSIIKFDKKIIA